MPGFALFDTPIGICGMVWADRGVIAVQWPGASAEGARSGLLRRFAHAVEAEPPVEVAAAIEGVIALLRGERRDLKEVRLDMARAPDLHRRVWEIARDIPPGETRTYGEIARQLGDPMLAREVGQALGANPFPIIVPCHRVLAAGGKIGGFSAPGGIDSKRRVLGIESALARREPDLFNR